MLIQMRNRWLLYSRKRGTRSFCSFAAATAVERGRGLSGGKLNFVVGYAAGATAEYCGSSNTAVCEGRTRFSSYKPRQTIPGLPGTAVKELQR